MDFSFLEKAGIAEERGFSVWPVSSFSSLPERGTPVVVTGISSEEALSGAAGVLRRVYRDTAEAVLWYMGKEEAVRFPLGHPPALVPGETCVLIADTGEMETRPAAPFSLDDLLSVMRALREEGGCPWDRAQTGESLRTYFLQEAYEVVDAIDRGDMENLKEELGDVLYQIVFHARIAEEKGLFTMQDVADGIAGKMVRRHPHVFGGGESGKHEDASWEAQKLREKRRAHLLDGLPLSLPSLLFACIMQKKVSSICNEKTEPQPDWESLLAEMPRLAAGDSGSEEREFLFGRAFFEMVRFAGLCGVDPELALHRFNRRYARRLGLLENRLREEGKTLADAAPAMLRELSADGQGGNGSLSSECGV